VGRALHEYRLMSTVNTLLFCVFLALAGLSQQAHALPLHDGDKGQLDLSFSWRFNEKLAQEF